MSLITVIPPREEVKDIKDTYGEELLKTCAKILRMSPKKVIPQGDYKDTHMLAANIEQHLKSKL